MKKVKGLGVLMLCFAWVHCSMVSQEITLSDYNRAVGFTPANLYNKTAFNLRTDVHWFKDHSGLWFVDYNTQGHKFMTVSFKDYSVKPLFDHGELAASLKKILGDSIDQNHLSLKELQKKGSHVLTFKIGDRSFSYNATTKHVEPLVEETAGSMGVMERRSPDGKWVAYAKDYNLYIKSTETGKEYPLSFDGEKDFEYGLAYHWFDTMEGENGERPKRFVANWSKDSKWLSTGRWDLRNTDKMYLLDWSVDSLYRPRLLSYYRGSPGDTTMVHVKPVFFNVQTKKEVKTELPNNTHINAVSIQWSDSSGVLYANYRERGFKKEYVQKIDLNTGKSEPLIIETSRTNIDNFRFWPLENHRSIIFLSERSGWRQLYRFDLDSGKVEALTNGAYYINDVPHIDQKTGTIFFLASGREEGRNPYHQALYRVSLKGKVKALTEENAHHAISFSPEGTYVVDNYSTVQIPTRTALREAKTGKILAILTQAELDLPVDNWQAPEVFQLKAKDKKTVIYGAFWKPSNFDATKKYPVIDHSYTGPHTQVFPKSFDRAFQNQSLAELGFVVVMIDGLGSAGRSKAFHDHSYKNMGANLEDHVLAIRYLGNTYAWVDTDRVGIFGHSAGGYDAGHAVLAFPELYKVAVASSADHDFRMEKAWWPEMYMGWPVDESYEAVSNITMAGNLQGKLLLVHGGLDDNVNPSATFKLAEALIKNDKDFDMLILPSQRHGYQGPYSKYFTKRKWNYFVEHLLYAKPIWNFDWK